MYPQNNYMTMRRIHQYLSIIPISARVLCDNSTCAEHGIPAHHDIVTYCDFDALPDSCKSWRLYDTITKLLFLSCEYCSGNGYCKYQSELAEVAWEVQSANDAPISCLVGYTTALLINMQYSISPPVIDDSIPDELVEMFSTGVERNGFSLHPFPIYHEGRTLLQEIYFHSNFLAADRMACDQEGVNQILI